MRALITSTDADPTVDTILVIPHDGSGDNFETLGGERVDVGFVVHADNEPLTEAVNTSARQRAAEGVTAKRLVADVRWLSQRTRRLRARVEDRTENRTGRLRPR